MSGTEREEYASWLHERLLQQDPVAPSEFAEAFLDELVRRLRAKVGTDSQESHLLDAATDALLDYVQNPSKFNPNKSALLTYLTMAAHGDFLNLLAKEKRMQRREIPLQDVEETLSDGNNIVTETENRLWDGMTGVKRKELLSRIQATFPNARDRTFLELMMNGERRTAAFCVVLGIQSLSPEDQRKLVKRNKDRITKRLQRLGGKIHGTE